MYIYIYIWVVVEPSHLKKIWYMIRQILGASSTPTPRIGGEKIGSNPHLQGSQLGNGLVPGARVDHQNLSGGSLWISRHGWNYGKNVQHLPVLTLGGITQRFFFLRFKKKKHPSTPWTWFPVDFFPSKIHQSWELSMALAVAMVCEQNVNQLKFSTNTNT